MNAAAVPQFSITSFEAGTIDIDAFDHEAHVYVAWLYLERFPLLEAIGRFSDALRRLTIQLGVPGKYHETITWFFMFVIEERCQEPRTGGWFSFQRDNADLFARGDDNILNRYYSSDLLASNRARQSFVLPDRLASQDRIRTVPRFARSR